MSPARRPTLPAADVGGVFGSRIRNGFSDGLRSFFTRTQRFTGAVAKFPAITNAVIGPVGQNRHAENLYAGVMSQLTQYYPSQSQYAANWIGNIPTSRLPIEPGNNA